MTFGDNDSGGIVSDYFIIGGPGMDSNTVTISELISGMLAEARRLGMSEATIWREWEPKTNDVAWVVKHYLHYCESLKFPFLAVLYADTGRISWAKQGYILCCP